jgi:hypothetical protein
MGLMVQDSCEKRNSAVGTALQAGRKYDGNPFPPFPREIDARRVDSTCLKSKTPFSGVSAKQSNALTSWPVVRLVSTFSPFLVAQKVPLAQRTRIRSELDTNVGAKRLLSPRTWPLSVPMSCLSLVYRYHDMDGDLETWKARFDVCDAAYVDLREILRRHRFLSGHLQEVSHGEQNSLTRPYSYAISS